jgi:hypothetical protein
MGEVRNTYKIFVGKPEWKKELGRPRGMWEDNIRTDLREIGFGVMDWIHLAQDKDHSNSGSGRCEMNVILTNPPTA